MKTEFVAVKWGLASCAPLFWSVSIIIANASDITEEEATYVMEM